MEAIPALPRYSVWCPIQENFLVMRGERGRGGKREGEKGGRGREREGEKNGIRNNSTVYIYNVGRR